MADTSKSQVAHDKLAHPGKVPMGIYTIVANDTEEHIATYKVINAATKANPGVLTTTAAHGLTTGDKVYINGIVGMTELNDKFFNVVVLTATTFSLKSLTGVVINTTDYTTYTSDGIVVYSTPIRNFRWMNATANAGPAAIGTDGNVSVTTNCPPPGVIMWDPWEDLALIVAYGKIGYEILYWYLDEV